MKLGINIDPLDGPSVLSGLVGVNVSEIQRAGVVGTPVLDGLLNGSIVYIEADPDEEWQTWAGVLATGGGDCEDLVSAVVAEALCSGIPARPVVYDAGDGLFHVVVELTRSQVYLDPSRTGGM